MFLRVDQLYEFKLFLNFIVQEINIGKRKWKDSGEIQVGYLELEFWGLYKYVRLIGVGKYGVNIYFIIVFFYWLYIIC